MSYILDALKRADAERERGQVPGLHSQASRTPVPPDAARSPDRRQTDGRRLWMIALTLLAIGVLAAMLWWGRGAPVATEHPPAPAVPATVPLSPATPTAPPPAPALTAPAPPVAPILAPPPAPSAEQAATPPAAAAPPAVPQKAASPVIRFADLSTAQRTQLPQLSISGASYSENPAHRLLIVNGQVVQEGQAVAPGLVLEQIGAREAVLNQRGLRFSVGY
jgi:general secretion pathway protein B